MVARALLSNEGVDGGRWRCNFWRRLERIETETLTRLQWEWPNISLQGRPGAECGRNMGGSMVYYDKR